MNRRRNPPPVPHRRRNPPPVLNHQTTTQILKQTTYLFCSRLLTFLLLSTLVFIFRYNVHFSSNYVSSLIDRDHSSKPTLSRVDFSARQPHHHRHRRRSAPLHSPPAGALDDDFFSGDFDRSLFPPAYRKPTPNATPIVLSDFSHHGFSEVIMDNGVSYSSIFQPGAFSFNLTFLEEEPESVDTGSDYGDGYFDFLIKAFELGRQDTTISTFFLAGVLSTAYGCSVFAFFLAYTWANGVIFLKVVDHLVGGRRSILNTFWEGLDIGVTRLWCFILMKWAVKAALALLMGIYFFGVIEHRYLFFKVFLGVMFLPFSNLPPSVKGLEWASSDFTVIWFLIDLLVGLLFSVDSWVAFVNPRRGVWEIVRDGWRLLVSLFCPALEIRMLEAIVCGSIGRWVLMGMLGEVYTMIFQSVMEVYFMVAWLVFYFAVRQMDDAAHGRPFGRRELGGLLDIDR